MSGPGEDTVPKIKISTTLFVAGERRCVLDRFRFRPVCCGFRVYCSNKPTRLGVRRRMPSRRIAGSSRGEERRRTTRRRDGRPSGPCASAPSSSDREPVKKGSKSWSTPVCDCLEKETKTVIREVLQTEFRKLRRKRAAAGCESRKIMAHLSENPSECSVRPASNRTKFSVRFCGLRQCHVHFSIVIGPSTVSSV